MSGSDAVLSTMLRGTLTIVDLNALLQRELDVGPLEHKQQAKKVPYAKEAVSLDHAVALWVVKVNLVTRRRWDCNGYSIDSWYLYHGSAGRYLTNSGTRSQSLHLAKKINACGKTRRGEPNEKYFESQRPKIRDSGCHQQYFSAAGEDPWQNTRGEHRNHSPSPRPSLLN